MHRNLNEKEYFVLNLAIQNQKDQYLDQIEESGDSDELGECLSILQGVEDKLNVSNPQHKDVLKMTGTETTVGYSLKEVQSMYIALYTFNMFCKTMHSTNIHDEIPKEELGDLPLTRENLLEYVDIASQILFELEDSFHAAGIKVSDFFTLHDNEDSFYRATGRKVKGSDRNSPCYCGSGKKYKNCCGK